MFVPGFVCICGAYMRICVCTACKCICTVRVRAPKLERRCERIPWEGEAPVSTCSWESLSGPHDAARRRATARPQWQQRHGPVNSASTFGRAARSTGASGCHFEVILSDFKRQQACVEAATLLPATIASPTRTNTQRWQHTLPIPQGWDLASRRQTKHNGRRLTGVCLPGSHLKRLHGTGML